MKQKETDTLDFMAQCHEIGLKMDRNPKKITSYILSYYILKKNQQQQTTTTTTTENRPTIFLVVL